MKKQLLIVALTLGFVATTECHKNNNNTYQLAPGSSIQVKYGKKTPTNLPAGVTATKVTGKKKTWTFYNTNQAGTAPVPIRRKK